MHEPGAAEAVGSAGFPPALLRGAMPQPCPSCVSARPSTEWKKPTLHALKVTLSALAVILGLAACGDMSAPAQGGVPDPDSAVGEALLAEFLGASPTASVLPIKYCGPIAGAEVSRSSEIPEPTAQAGAERTGIIVTTNGGQLKDVAIHVWGLIDCPHPCRMSCPGR